MKQADFDAILDECVARLQNGATIEECLANYPDRAAELRPLLEMAAGIYALPTSHARSLAVQDGRRRMLAALAENPPRQQRLWAFLFPAQPALAFALVAILAVALLLVFASPTEWLVAVQKWLLPDGFEPPAAFTPTATQTPCCQTVTATTTPLPQPLFVQTISPRITITRCFWEQCGDFVLPIDTRYPFPTGTSTRRPTITPTSTPCVVAECPGVTETAVSADEEDRPTARPSTTSTPSPSATATEPPTHTPEPSETPTPSPIPYPYPVLPTPTPSAYP